MRDDMSNEAIALGLVMLLACSFLIGLAVGSTSGDKERERAIKAGVAHWTIDPVTGEKRFEYKVKP